MPHGLMDLRFKLVRVLAVGPRGLGGRPGLARTANRTGSRAPCCSAVYLILGNRVLLPAGGCGMTPAPNSGSAKTPYAVPRSSDRADGTVRPRPQCPMAPRQILRSRMRPRRAGRGGLQARGLSVTALDSSPEAVAPRPRPAPAVSPPSKPTSFAYFERPVRRAALLARAPPPRSASARRGSAPPICSRPEGCVSPRSSRSIGWTPRQRNGSTS